MSFNATQNATFVRIFDTAMQRAYFMPLASFQALDLAAPFAQARIEAAAEFAINGRGEISKSSLKMDALINELLTLRGGAVKPTIPLNVLEALAALNAAVLAG